MPCPSIVTYRRAVECGADILHVKIAYTRDGKIIVVQDELLKQAFQSYATVSRLTLEEIAARLKNILDHSQQGDHDFKGWDTLENIMTALPDRRFNLELMSKSLDFIHDLGRLLKELDAGERVLVYSMYGSVVDSIRKMMPETAVSVSLYRIVWIYALFRSGLLYFKRRFRSDVMQIPESIGPSYIANRALIRECIVKGLRIYVSVDNTRNQIQRLYESGASGFITDNVAFVKSILDEIVIEEPEDDLMSDQ